MFTTPWFRLGISAYRDARRSVEIHWCRGAGVTSTPRTGAAVASADDVRGARLIPRASATTLGHHDRWSAAADSSYAMELQRRVSYDVRALATARNEAAICEQPQRRAPPLGIGRFPPARAAVVTDRGALCPICRLAAGIYAPNAYPFRDMCSELAGGPVQKSCATRLRARRRPRVTTS